MALQKKVWIPCFRELHQCYTPQTGTESIWLEAGGGETLLGELGYFVQNIIGAESQVNNQLQCKQ